MRKIFVIATMVAATILASCSKNMDTNIPEPANGEGPQVQITFGPEAGTRAFFSTAATAETWEKDITVLSVYVFNKSGNLVVRRSLSAAEIEAKSTRFPMPNSVAGTDCSFYVVANADYGHVATAAAMEALAEKATLDEYNGAFTTISQGRKRTAGFVMTGKTTATIAAAGSSTTVDVTLKRTVAKIAVRATVSSAFTSTYNGGNIVIRSVKMSKASALSNLFLKSGDYKPRTSLYEFTQAVNTNNHLKENLFYVYENGQIAAGSRVMLTFTGYFDADGNDTTTTDRINV